jgi:hypothetical protein
MGQESVPQADLVIKSAAEFNVKYPQPGAYRGVPSELYFAARATNHSTIREIARSPAHFRVARDEPSHKESDAMRLGSLAHMMLFEPHLVASSTIPPPINERTKAPYGSETKAWAEYVALNPGKLIVTPDEWVLSNAMVKAIRANTKIAPILSAASHTEVVIIFDRQGVRCKAKVDALVPGLMVCDLKTTLDASDRRFVAKVQQLYYYTQAAFYLMAVESLGMKGMDFLFACVESDKPHGTAAYIMGRAFRQIGRERVDFWLSKVAQCEASNEWPCYPDELIELEPDTWFLAKYSDGGAM